MFQYEFFNKKKYHRAAVKGALPSDFLGLDDIELVRSSYWAEHCLECGEPLCYSTCAHFERRADDRCVRFPFGIRNSRDMFAAPYAAELQFGPWGKLETIVRPGVMEPAAFMALHDEWLGKCNGAAKRMRSVFTRGKYSVADRQRFDSDKYGASEAAGTPNMLATPQFLFQCYSFEAAAFTLFLEISDGPNPVFREAINVQPGFNQAVVDVSAVFPGDDTLRAKIYPENDYPAHIALLFNEFVALTPKAAGRLAGASQLAGKAAAAGQASGLASGQVSDGAPTPGQVSDGSPTASAAEASANTPSCGQAPAPAAKVKCVAWDLDNTTWDGVLIEADPETLSLRPGVLELMKALDARGIIQVVVSKNDEEPVLGVLKRLGVADYYVGTYINWDAKSINLTRAAADLNLGIDSFALIDDSAFERGEVHENLPQVRVYSEAVVAPVGGASSGAGVRAGTGMTELLTLPEFDVPVTADGAKRRLMYQTENKRKQAAQAGTGNQIDFLRSCKLRLSLGNVATPEQKQRSFELLQRTNQLNLSGKKCTAEEFDARLTDLSRAHLCGSCEDRFGSYGQVLYLEARLEGSTVVVDEFAMSCRVAGKCIEAALASALLAHFPGATGLELRGKKTSRNGLLCRSFGSAGFVDASVGDGLLLRLPSADALVNPSVVEVSFTK